MTSSTTGLGFRYLNKMRRSIIGPPFLVAFTCAAITVLLKAWELSGFGQVSQFLAVAQITPSAYNGFSGLLGFLVVFRTSQAYSRYWNGCLKLQQFMGNWFEAGSSICSFSSNTKVDAEKLANF